MAGSDRHHGGPRQRAVRGMLLTFVLGLALLAAPGAADDSSGAIFERIGTLPTFGADTLVALGPDYVDPSAEGLEADLIEATGRMILLPEARQVWQLYPYRSKTDFQVRTPAIVRDLDTLSVLTVVHLSVPGSSNGLTYADGWRYTVDPGRRLFLLDIMAAAIVSVDLRTFDVSIVPIGPAPRALPFSKLGAMHFDPYDDSILLAYGSPASTSALNTSTYLFKVPLNGGLIQGPRRVQSCTGPMSSTEFGQSSVPMLIPNPSTLFLPCTRAGGVATVVKLSRPNVMTPTSAEEFTTGPVGADSLLADPTSQRFVIGTDTGALWVFDSPTMAFVGVVAAHPDRRQDSPSLAYGVDDVTGDVFFLGPEYGLGVFDGRAFPVPQARSDSRLAAEGLKRLYSDAATGRLFVRPHGDVTGYAIYRPPSRLVPAAPPDPDANTIDMPETAGATESSFTASASGYGTRALMANGVIPLLPLPSVNALSPFADVFAKNLTSPCWFSDRDMFAGRVSKTEADTGSAAAAAIAADVDGRTKQDLERPSRCDPSVKDSNGQTRIQSVFGTAPGLAGALDDSVGQAAGWERDPAVCTTSAGEASKTGTPDDHGAPPLGSSEVQCAVPDGKSVVKATAEGSLTGGVTVGRSSAWTEIRRDERGIVTTAHAVASDIVLGGLVRIGEVRSSATSISNGRPGKAPLSEHTSAIRGVSIGDRVICAGTCDGAQLSTALNAIAAGRVQFRVGKDGTDAGLLKGSPRGALTAVQKSPQRQVSDQALAGDFTVEVPALEMVVYNDNYSWGRARQIYQFAGVATGANYNIIRLPEPIPAAPVIKPPAEVSGPVAETVESLPGIEGSSGTPGTPGTPGTLSTGASLAGSQAQVAPSAGGGGGVRGAVGDILTGIGKGLRLVWGDWRQAILLFTVWLLLAQPVLLARRRSLLHRVQSV